jgi:hypothetical protein
MGCSHRYAGVPWSLSVEEFGVMIYRALLEHHVHRTILRSMDTVHHNQVCFRESAVLLMS